MAVVDVRCGYAGKAVVDGIVVGVLLLVARDAAVLPAAPHCRCCRCCVVTGCIAVVATVLVVVVGLTLRLPAAPRLLALVVVLLLLDGARFGVGCDEAVKRVRRMDVDADVFGNEEDDGLTVVLLVGGAWLFVAVALAAVVVAPAPAAAACRRVRGRWGRIYALVCEDMMAWCWWMRTCKTCGPGAIEFRALDGA